MRSNWRAARLGVLVLGLAACRDRGEYDVQGDADTTASAECEGSSTTQAADEPDPCAAACIDTADEAGAARCHGCRCRVAFDGWMPTPDQIQCANATPIVTYDADVSTGALILEPAPIQAVTCANPSLLTGSCRPGSKLGRLQHDDVTVQWICRDPYLDLDQTVIYHDVAVIGHNARTGATCFWDDIDDVIHDDDLPRLDLTDASADEHERHLAVFDPVDPSVCTRCHDHDPFVYTPYLESTGWVSVAANRGPYALVALEPGLVPVDASHLVSARATPCVACHRLGSHETCRRFAADAMGLNKGNAYQGEVRDAAVAGSPHWRLAHWMPSASLPIADYDAWLSTFADARDHILSCCASPGQDIDDCRWAPVPAQ